MRALLERNPNVVLAVCGHSHIGIEPYTIAERCVQAWAWRPGRNQERDYEPNALYTVVEVDEGGVRFIERSAREGAEEVWYEVRGRPRSRRAASTTSGSATRVPTTSSSGCPCRGGAGSRCTAGSSGQS